MLHLEHELVEREGVKITRLEMDERNGLVRDDRAHGLLLHRRQGAYDLRMKDRDYVAGNLIAIKIRKFTNFLTQK